jgi:hypothetical protein
MKPLDEIKEKLKALKPVLEEKYKVKNIGIFGSYAKGTPTKKSDLDVLVEFKEPISLIKFVELKHFLEKQLGIRKVDLVSKSALKPRIGKRILKEVMYV